MATPSGFWFRLDPTSWRFYPCLGGYTGGTEGTFCVTGAPDVHAASAAINSGAGVPTGDISVAYADLVSAGSGPIGSIS